MQEAVLVLNANYEPIHICNMQRAMGLILSNKATLVLDGRGIVRTINRNFPRPSVIRLEKMISRPRPRIKLTRREVLRRDNYTCQYCGRHSSDLTVDHVIPRHLGGPHAWNNLVAACPACNHRKGGQRLEKVGMHLLRIPREPPATARYIFGRNPQDYAEWEPFLAGW